MDNLEQQIEARLNELSDDELNKLAIHLKSPRAHEGIQAPLGVKISDLQRMNFVKWVKGTGNVQKAGIYLGIIGESALPKEELSKQQRTIEIAKSQSIHAPKEKFRQSNTFKFVVIPLLGIIVMAIVGIPAWISLFRKAGQHSIVDTNIFAYVSKDGTILQSKNFPWKISKSKDKEDNVIYIINGRYGDSSAASVFPDNSINEYMVYNAISGVAVKFTCPEEEISNFTIKLKY